MKFVELEFYGSSYGHEEELFRWRHGGIDKHSIGDAPPTFTRDYLTTAKIYLVKLGYGAKNKQQL